MPAKKMTATSEARYHDLVRQISQMQLDLRYPLLARGQLPPEWAEIRAAPAPHKLRITLRVDADVAKFFRALGRDYQKTVNRVLRTFMLARLCEVLPEPKALQLGDADAAAVEAMAQEVALVERLDKLRRKRLG